ncbi:MAG: DUF748 domain-containing protein [Candidatus Omnitrophica bacterium]|nr:DUF748 domain-containing protein [Candidatus Omnitrophota bacterium]
MVNILPKMSVFNFFILLLAVFVLVIFLFQSTLPVFLKTFFSSRLSAALDADVTIDDIILNFFVGTIRFEGLKIEGAHAEGVSVSIRSKELVVDFNLIELLRRKIVLDSVRFNRVSVVFEAERREGRLQRAPSAFGLIVAKSVVDFDSNRLFKEDSEGSSRAAAHPGKIAVAVAKHFARPFVIRKIAVENANVFFVDYTEDGKALQTGLEDIEAFIDEIRYPARADGKIEFKLSAIVSATKLGRASANGTIQPYRQGLDFSLALDLDDIYIPHFKSYLFSGRNYDIYGGRFDLRSKMICRNGFIRSKNEVTLSDLELAALGEQANTVDDTFRLLKLSGGVFAILLNRATASGLTFTFGLDADINDPRLADGKIIADRFLPSLEKRLVALLKETPGGMRGLLGSLITLPSWSASEKEAA